MKQRPSVLVLAGLDPSGGAGIQADIETLNDLGCQARPIVTSLTVQNSSNVIEFSPVDCHLAVRQFEALQTDMRFQAIKIGMIGSIEMLQAIVAMLRQLPEVSVILDPVLAAGGGKALGNSAFAQALKQTLLPLVSVATPNLPEARHLSGYSTPGDCAKALLESGCEHMLITGTHDDGKNVVNRLYSQNETSVALTCERLTGEFHGSGCTFASALAAGIALGKTTREAFELAHNYTHQSLRAADTPGKGQAFPRRNQKYFKDD